MYQLSIDGIPQFPVFLQQNDRDYAVGRLLELGVRADSFGGNVEITDLGIKTTIAQHQLQYYMTSIFCPPHYYPSDYLKTIGEIKNGI